MLIIYGKKETNKTIGAGTFFCPHCYSDQPYWHKTVQEKGHLYWISLLPLGEKYEFVECRTCKEIYQPEVLSFDRESLENSYRSDFDLILRHLMVLMMLANAVADEAEIDTLILIFKEVTGVDLSRDEVLADMAEAKASGHSVIEYLPAMAAVLTDESKALVIHAVYLIAQADGSIEDSEVDILAAVAEALEMDETQVNLALGITQEKE